LQYILGVAIDMSIRRTLTALEAQRCRLPAPLRHATGFEIVCFRGQTGSDRRAVKPTRMTQAELEAR
jgi:hypothetical protein